MYERIKHAITYTDLIIREDINKDTLITYSERIDGTTIYGVAKVVVNDNKLEISEGFGLGLEDFWGYPAWLKSYSV